ncbi:MAG: RNA degradosome polyphosphate kinase, partial [Blastochloris sp.]|nr:RNA degradosome polyphosphate kinase [Blastochloris sp.]
MPSSPSPNISPDLSLPAYYFNRELSWLEFNQRVLEEALDPTTPLLERVKFLCITSSNLDEFFEIRVAGIKQQIENKTSDPGPDGLEAQEVFKAIHDRVSRMVQDQYRLWNEQLLPALHPPTTSAPSAVPKLPESERLWTLDFFQRENLPRPHPPGHPTPA